MTRNQIKLRRIQLTHAVALGIIGLALVAVIT